MYATIAGSALKVRYEPLVRLFCASTLLISAAAPAEGVIALLLKIARSVQIGSVGLAGETGTFGSPTKSGAERTSKRFPRATCEPACCKVCTIVVKSAWMDDAGVGPKAPFESAYLSKSLWPSQTVVSVGCSARAAATCVSPGKFAMTG